MTHSDPGGPDSVRIGFRTLILAVVSATMLMAGVAHAQSVSSSLNGRVRTHQGTPVADVVVRAVSQQSGQVRMAITDGKGRYRFEVIEPGKWTIWAEVSDGENHLVLSCILVVSIMHFWYDGFIWSVRKKQV